MSEKKWMCYSSNMGQYWSVVDTTTLDGALGVGILPPKRFGTQREALAEAIRQNEGLASALTLEIARLKEELASCKD